MKNVTLVNGKNKRDTYQVVFSEPKDVKDYFDFHDRKSKEEYTLDDEGVKKRMVTTSSERKGSTLYF